MDIRELDIANVRADRVVQVTLYGFFVNLLLTGIKYLAGFWGNSGAMLADATHSLSDILTDAAILLGFLFVRKPADEDHRYGHGKVETLITSFCGVILTLAGAGILLPALLKLRGFWQGVPLELPTPIALSAAFISIISKEWLYRYTLVRGKELNSSALLANAWHHRSDAFSSIGTAIGIGGALLGGERWAVLDPIAAGIVSLLILKVGIQILLGSLNELIECSIGEDEENFIKELLCKNPHIKGFHALQSRKIGYYIAIEAHIFVDRSMNIVDAHDVSTELENQLRAHFGEETHINFHIEPLPLHGETHEENVFEGNLISKHSDAESRHERHGVEREV